jgi:hypothetical protein
MTMVSCVLLTGIYLYPVQSNRDFPFFAVESCIGTQDTNQTSKDWRTGYLECGNEHTLQIVLFSGDQIGIRCQVGVVKMSTVL